MITKEKVREVYERVRAEYSYPPTKLVLEESAPKRAGLSAGPPAPFYIDNMEVHIEWRKLEDEECALSIMRHELGHPHYAPVSMENHWWLLNETVRTCLVDNETAHEMSNVSSDLIVEYSVRKILGGSNRHKLEVLWRKKEFRDEVNSNTVLRYMLAVYGAMTGFKPVKIEKEIRLMAAKALKIIGDSMGVKPKMLALNHLIRDMFLKRQADKKKAREKLFEMLKGALKQVSVNGHGDPMTAEDLNGSKAQSIVVLAGNINHNNPAAKGNFLLFAGRHRVNLEEIDLLRAKAKKNIRFALKGRESIGPDVPAGTQVWFPDESVAGFDPEAGLCDAGINIPGITTRKRSYVAGTLMSNKAFSKNLVLVIDTSGSMDRTDTAIAAFGLISAAEIHGISVGVVMFDHNVYKILPISDHYRKLEGKFWSSYEEGGTCIVPAISAAERMGPGNHVVIVSDFHGEGRELVNRALARLKISNSVTAISMFGGIVPEGVSVKEARTADELNDALIEEIEEYSAA